MARVVGPERAAAGLHPVDREAVGPVGPGEGSHVGFGDLKSESAVPRVVQGLCDFGRGYTAGRIGVGHVSFTSPRR